MNIVSKNELYLRIKNQAFNSSHFIWLWTDLNFVSSSQGWIFGLTHVLGVHLLALEPLPPTDLSFDDPSLIDALLELKIYLSNGPIAFVGINAELAQKLCTLGFSSLQIGKEPWVELSNIKPTGHIGRKVRAGRNQALKSGLFVEEWNLSDVLANQKKLQLFKQIKTSWENQSLISLTGFLNGMSFEHFPQDRKCFVAINKENNIEGILIISPIEKDKSWFFEDMLLNSQSHASKGVGELLTLTALETLQLQGFQEISLGVVSMTSLDKSDFGKSPPHQFLKFLKCLQLASGFFYNSGGIELFRRRFKIARWDKIYLSVCEEKQSQLPHSIQWIQVSLAIIAAFKPKLNFHMDQILVKMIAPLKKHPTSLTFLFFSILSYFLVAKYPLINEFISQNLEFSLNASLWQWPFRTITSEIIYFSRGQFEFFTSIIFLLLFFIEKKVFDRKWVWYLLAIFFSMDMMTRTLSGFVYRNIYHSISLLNILKFFPMNGGETILASIVGFAVSLTGQKKDEWFALGFLAFIAASFILPTFGMQSLAVLYGTTFYIGGYLIGKYYLKYQSHKDALINKNKNESLHCN